MFKYKVTFHRIIDDKIGEPQVEYVIASSLLEARAKVATKGVIIERTERIE
jgi:hypothetical protein